MKTIDLLVTRDERVVMNIPEEYSKRSDLAKLKTSYMTLSSYDENGVYNWFDIELIDINIEEGHAEFRVGTGSSDVRTFTIKSTDDPIVIFDDYDPGVEHHIFKEIADYEINQEIKQGRLYKFQKVSTHEWFLAVVQSVGATLITLHKLDIVRNKDYNPPLYSLCQHENIFSIFASDKFCVDKFKNYVVTELCDLTAMFDDKEENDKNELENQEEETKVDSNACFQLEGCETR